MREVYGFLEGTLVDIENVSDPVFSQKMLGQGVAIAPGENGKIIYAPFNGMINLVAGTCHAVGITDEDGNEFLIHIGIETVSLKGEGFKPLVAAGDNVEKGTPLMEVDFSFIKKKGLDPVTVLVNCDYKIPEFEILAKGKVDEKTKILAF